MPKDEVDTVSDLRYSWKKLRKLATEVSDGLAKLQVCFMPAETQQCTAQAVMHVSAVKACISAHLSQMHPCRVQCCHAASSPALSPCHQQRQAIVR